MTCFYVSLDFVHKIMNKEFLSNSHHCAVWTLVSCEERIMICIENYGFVLSGIANKNKLPLSKSLSFCVYPKQKVVDNNIIKCFGSNAILRFDTGWEFSISYVLINVMKMGGMLICFYKVLCLDW